MIMNGSRVIAFDPKLYKNDEETPIKTTMKPGTVICRYGEYNKIYNVSYDDLVDIQFDHRPDKISKGHFTSLVKEIRKEK